MARSSALDSHQREAVLENIKFLRENGMHDEQIAKRLGMKVTTMQKMAGYGSTWSPDDDE